MKTRNHLIHALGLMLVAAVSGQDSAPVLVEEPIAAAPATPADVPLRSPEELDELLGPVALYPDAVIALLLPASTMPTDIVLAARFLDAGGAESELESQSWDESVVALARFPEVIEWLNKNLEWTVQLGDAFLAQPADVMKSVQRLRAKARAAGTLSDTEQQRVVVEKEVITIVPAQPDVIYIPYYDPTVVYVGPGVVYDGRPFVSFGIGFMVGSWMSYDCDWYHYRVWHRYRHFDPPPHYDWRYPRFPGRPGYVDSPHYRPWRPSPRHHPGFRRDEFRHDRRHERRVIARPGPMPDRHDRPRDLDRPRDGDREHAGSRPDRDRERDDRPHRTPPENDRTPPNVVDHSDATPPRVPPIKPRRSPVGPAPAVAPVADADQPAVRSPAERQSPNRERAGRSDPDRSRRVTPPASTRAPRPAPTVTPPPSRPTTVVRTPSPRPSIQSPAPARPAPAVRAETAPSPRPRTVARTPPARPAVKPAPAQVVRPAAPSSAPSRPTTVASTTPAQESRSSSSARSERSERSESPSRPARTRDR